MSMKAKTSSLNPYATSYIPLSQRGTTAVNKDYKLDGIASTNGNGTESDGTHFGDTPQGGHLNTVNVNDTLQIAKGSTFEGNSFHDFYVLSSQNANEITEKHILDGDPDMDLAYLQMIFPGISDESLSEVYFANKGDLGATVDMLNQLEFNSLEKLPDTLDIGDVEESGHSSKFAYQKLKKLAGEVDDSLSNSSASAFVV